MGYFGSFLVADCDARTYSKENVDSRISSMDNFSRMEENHTRDDFAGLMQSLQNEWVYIQHSMSLCEDAFTRLGAVLSQNFASDVLGMEEVQD